MDGTCIRHSVPLHDECSFSGVSAGENLSLDALENRLGDEGFTSTSVTEDAENLFRFISTIIHVTRIIGFRIEKFLPFPPPLLELLLRFLLLREEGDGGCVRRGCHCRRWKLRD